MPQLVYSTTLDAYVCRCDFSSRDIPKNAGFRWNREKCLWWTRDLAAAAKLRHLADEEAATRLARHFIEMYTFSSAGLPEIADSLLSHQRLATLFALERNRSYLGLDPGLGKTACAAVTAKTLKWPVVYVTPPFLKANVENEFKKWGDHPVDIYPDTTLEKDFDPALYPAETLYIVDEAHRFKNPEAKRTQAVFSFLPCFKRAIFMSGTPIPNRPMELYPVLHHAAPECIDFMSKFEFGRKYCAGHKGKWGWDFSGASNMAELSRRVLHPTGPFMLRIRKNVLNLPPKTEEVFVLSDTMPERVASMEKAITERYSKAEDIIRYVLAAADDKDELHTASYRRLLGVHKAKAALPFLHSILEDTEDGVIIFAHHKEVVATLKDGLKDYAPLIITGDTPTGERQKLVDAFQTKKSHRVMVGNITAMGVGFTLTKASRCIFVEYDWVPGVNDQASDRLHRIGQDKNVLVQYLAFKNSIDLKVFESLVKKRSTLKHL